MNTVSQVTKYLLEMIETDRFLSNIYIAGEISSATLSSAGHRYFTLKDSDSQIRCVMFNGGIGGEHVQHGVSIAAHGRVGLYRSRGDLQLYVDVVQPEGVGALHLDYLRLKAKLEAEGLFEESRKRSLPDFPSHVAVITSRTGAVWHDVQNIIARRFPAMLLTLVHSPVQGPEAVKALLEALASIDAVSGIDVVILARGGGSLEELAAFNDESVARAIYRSKVPVVTGVGHETDFTIADLVADVRASTPSAAAEIVSPDRGELALRLQDIRNTLLAHIVGLVRSRRDELHIAASRLQRLSPDCAVPRRHIAELVRGMSSVVWRELALLREQTAGRMDRLKSLNPDNTLARGYCVVELENRTVVDSIDQVRKGSQIFVHVSDGSFGSVVDSTVVGSKNVARKVLKSTDDAQRSFF